MHSLNYSVDVSFLEFVTRLVLCWIWLQSGDSRQWYGIIKYCLLMLLYFYLGFTLKTSYYNYIQISKLGPGVMLMDAYVR